MKFSKAVSIVALSSLSSGANESKNSVAAFTGVSTSYCASRSVSRRQSVWGSSVSLRLSAPPAEETRNVETGNADDDMPGLSREGIYSITSQEQYKALLAAHPDKIIIMKFFAPWCRACKGMAPKFIQVSRDDRYKPLPLIWGEMSVQNNKDFVKSIGILALPSVNIYAGGAGLVESFPCGPSKIPILKRKIAEVVNERVDATSLLLKEVSSVAEDECEEVEESDPCIERKISTTEGDVVVSEEQLASLRKIPYFKDFTDDEFNGLVDKARLVTFEAGSIIFKQGSPGKNFHVISTGEVEISLKTGFEDPLTTPPNYLGTVISTLREGDFFGERTLITGEPRAATIRAVEKTRCFTFSKNDIPTSSILGGMKQASDERLAQINDKYGVDMNQMQDVGSSASTKTANIATQTRGSINKPRPIVGVDNDEDVKDETNITTPRVASEDELISLMIRFKQARQVAKCFDYLMKTNPKWGDEGEVKRRSMLVSKLPPLQHKEFEDVFKIIDYSHDQKISLLEMKRFMESIGENRTDDELKDIMKKSHPAINTDSSITYDEFMGVMAEAEFYYLFTETFNVLDKRDSGFVRAGDLDRVLCGMQNLLFNDKTTVMVVEDMDMLIDYEQFSRMLLGAS